LEYQRANFSANINKYHIFSDKKLVNDVKERGMSGYDVKLMVFIDIGTKVSTLIFQTKA
jgi:hypothetical protein